MVVMGADDNVFVGFAGKVRGDIVHGFGLGADVDGEVHGEIRDRERVGMAVLIDLFREGAEILAGVLDPVFGCIVFDTDEEDAGVFGSGGFGEFAEVVGGSFMMVDIVD